MSALAGALELAQVEAIQVDPPGAPVLPGPLDVRDDVHRRRKTTAATVTAAASPAATSPITSNAAIVAPLLLSPFEPGFLGRGFGGVLVGVVVLVTIARVCPAHYAALTL